MKDTIHIISLGAGVQSSTMALMAVAGEIVPMPDAAIFADTQQEPESVYRYLAWLECELPYPVHRVTQGDLGELAIRTSARGKRYLRTPIPAFVLNASGQRGMLFRTCTRDFKLRPLRRKSRELMREVGASRVSQWIGISCDEAHRMKPAREKYIENRWPLIELRMTRSTCLSWMERHRYPKPPRSACTFCPYHSDREWARLKREEPESFEKAVQFEARLRSTLKLAGGGDAFLHSSMRPISESPFTDDRQASFGNDCEGLCGV